MLRVGDTVVIMSSPGTFEVLAIDDQEVTIQGFNGIQKVVLAQAVRRLERPAPPTAT